MSIWQLIRRWIGLQQNDAYRYALDEPIHLTLTDLAAQENRTPEELTANILAVGLTHYQNTDKLYQRWLALSAREQDVTALTCLGYTNRQIASRLGLSTETVKSYMQNALNKFGLHSKTDLRVTFAGWDFSAWEYRR